MWHHQNTCAVAKFENWWEFISNMVHTKNTAKVGVRGGKPKAKKKAPGAGAAAADGGGAAPGPSGVTPGPSGATAGPSGGAPTNAAGHPTMGGKCPRKLALKKLPDPKVNV